MEVRLVLELWRQELGGAFTRFADKAMVPSKVILDQSKIKIPAHEYTLQSPDYLPPPLFALNHSSHGRREIDIE